MRTLAELHHHLLEFVLIHLAMPDGDVNLRDQLAQLPCHRMDRLHPVVDHEDLAATVHLAQDCLPHE